MIKEKIIEYAKRSKKENKFLDFKSGLDVTSTRDWCELTKDVIAMANTGGGIIVFGVDDGGSSNGFNKDIILKLDPAFISEKISKYVDVDFTEFEVIELKRWNKIVAGIYIYGTSIPYVFSKNGVQINDGKKFKSVFAEGTVYFRRGAKSRPGNTLNIKNSFDNALTEVRKEWFKGMRQISELGINQEVNVEVKNQSQSSANLIGLIKLSEKGKLVKFTNSDVNELKKQYPFTYWEIVSKCKEKKKTKQEYLNTYIKKCKLDNSLSFNWRSVAKNLEIPTTIPEKFTYSPLVVKNFK
ncbi:MAG: ATP-binding protein [Candidatus Pacebacteria bacterium]|nr:ATP-binding protein [Candidatus Paceibacterota bacterium]